jgi:preprotein translocase subunit SecG
MDALGWLLVAVAIVVLVMVLLVLLRRSRRQGTVLAATPAKGRKR